ncbi:unnamed protein product [Clavelina lepadiformis]|uniref:ER membrane protein complex subunit 10 n=1 Tax=Clavelina lepadiformis TaxID=159417 RepID=A0ABP0GCB4_CLALP
MGCQSCVLFLLVALIYGTTKLQVIAKEDGYVLILEHSFNGEKFVKRGEIVLSDLKGEQATITQDPLSDEEKTALLEASKENRMYKLRVWSQVDGVSSNSNSGEGCWITSYTYAKFLSDSNLSDIITVNMDGLGNVVSLNIGTSLQKSDFVIDNDEFDTTIEVKVPNQAPVPDTHGFLHKMEKEKREKEIQAKEPQTVLGKYWIYLVPVGIFLLMSNAMQQQPQQ